jgi:hypothetical protein
MPTITISVSVPEGTTVSISGLQGAELRGAEPVRDLVEEYWTDYLSPSGRKLYGAAALIETVHGGGYTFEDIAASLSVDYESAKSYHRNSGRTAGRWERDKGTPPPIRLEFDGNYGPQDGVAGSRSRYSLPQDVAEKVRALPPVSPTPNASAVE